MMAYEEEFRTAVNNHLFRMGYKNIYILGFNADIGRATAEVKDRNGIVKKVRVIVPQNMTTIRRAHFRVTEI